VSRWLGEQPGGSRQSLDVNRIVAVSILLLWVVAAAVLTLRLPSVLSDQNEFLRGFVGHEFLAFMGVIVTITLASAANLYVALLRYEEQVGLGAFKGTKKDLRDSANFLIWALVSSVVVVALKPLFAESITVQSAFNAAALGILVASILILFDLTQAAFGLEPPVK
jgi:uncharacterized membrane protein (GlpM family)